MYILLLRFQSVSAIIVCVFKYGQACIQRPENSGRFSQVVVVQRLLKVRSGTSTW
jgi:hypothetical protein